MGGRRVRDDNGATNEEEGWSLDPAHRSIVDAVKGKTMRRTGACDMRRVRESI